MNMAAVDSSLRSDKVKGKQDRKTQLAARILLSKLKGSKSTVLKRGVLKKKKKKSGQGKILI